MFLVSTRNFPPELGGMQNLMEGLSNALTNHGPVKVFADNYQGPQQRETQECCPSKSQHRLHVFCWDFWSTSFTIG